MNNKISIGQLDRKISIYEKQHVKTASGEDDITEVLYRSTWAMADDKSSSEAEDGKIYLNAIRDYTIRHDDKIVQSGEQMVIHDDDGNYHIASIQRIGRKQFLILKAIKRE